VKPEHAHHAWAVVSTMTEKLQDHLAYPLRLLRADRAAAYLGISKRTFLRLVAKGKLPMIVWVPAPCGQ
jgi:hypothetical protein